MWYWHKDRYVDQWNKTKSPEINPKNYGQLIFNKNAKIIQWGKIVFSTNSTKIAAHPQAKASSSTPSLPWTKINFELTHRPKCKSSNYKTLKRKYLHELGVTFSETTPKAKVTKRKQMYWTSILNNLRLKKHDQENEKAIHSIKENILDAKYMKDLNAKYIKDS